MVVIGGVQESILNAIYPVGSVYISVSDTNPKVLFNFGEWEQIKDRFLLASGDTYAPGTTGGESEHKLTIDEMPEHAHKVGTELTDSPDALVYDVYKAINVGDTGLNGGNRYWSTGTCEAGGNSAHNNMPPYLTVYMWKRIK